MKRLITIVGDAYNQYLPVAEGRRIELGFSVHDTKAVTMNPEEVIEQLGQQLDYLINKSTTRGAITLQVQPDAIILTSDSLVLSPVTCNELSQGRVKVASRVGFGTTITILA